MNYSEILHNEHFQVFAGILRQFHQDKWPQVAVGHLYQRMRNQMGSATGWPQMDDFLGDFLEFLIRLVEANDLEPLYSTDDLDWLMELFSADSQVGREEVRAAMSLLFAVGTMRPAT